MARKTGLVLGLAVVGAGWGGVPLAWGQGRAKGLDASFDQVNFQTAANAGYEFGWVESTNGNITRAAYTHNITSAPSATFTYNGTTQHFLIGTYHYVNPGINSPATEVADFLGAARSYQTPGYLLPIEDLETGTASTLAVSSFSGSFSDALYGQLGFYPIFYSNENYARFMSGSAAAKTEGLWIGRPSFTDAEAQTGDPDEALSNPYGGYGAYATQPWTAWQYGGTTIGGASIDKNVAHGDLEFVKDLMIPAVRNQGAGGDWAAAGGWRNVSGNPTSGMNVWLDTTGALNTITLSSGANVTVRLFGVDRDVFSMSGGNFTATRGANFDGGVTVSGGVFTTPGVIALSTRLLPTGGATSTSGVLAVGGSGTVSAGGIAISTGAALTISSGGVVVLGSGGLAVDAGATVTVGPAAGQTAGVIDLGGGVRPVNVADGSGSVDLTMKAPMSNGGIEKTGAGTLALAVNNIFTQQVSLDQGITRVSAPGQLGGGVKVVSNTTVIAAGSSGYSGTLQLTGNGQTFGNALTLTGGGALGVSTSVGNTNPGALDNVGASNTWAGTITLAGAGRNGADPTENQISAGSGTALTITAAMVDGPGVNAFWIKNGPGDVVLSGAGKNTYSGITRVFNGRIVVEKDGALGAGGDTALASTFELSASAAVTVAFRAPAGSNGIAYNTDEWIFTNGVGAGGLGQVDNLGGDNTFAGSIGLTGPVVNGVATGSIGVSAGSLTLTGGMYGQGAGARGVTKLGAGTLVIAGDSSGTPTNPTAGVMASGSVMTIAGGGVVMGGTAGGGANVPGITSYVVNAGTSLSVGRVGAIGNAGIALNGGTVRTTGAGSHVLGAVAVGAGGGVVDTAGNSARFGGGLSGSSSITKAGAGAAVFEGVAGFNGGVTVSQGTLGIGGSGGVLRMNGLSMAGGVGTITGAGGGTRSNFIAAGSLDLVGNDGIVEYGAGSSPVDWVRQLITTGARGADGRDARVLWGGPGITSSAARGLALHQVAGAARGLGYGEASVYMTRNGASSFDGVGLSGTEVLVRYTYLGDANMDGVVNDADVDLVVANYQDSRRASGYGQYFTDRVWGDGDFNYDGVVDDRDIDLISATFGAGGAGMEMTAAGAAKLAALVAVPEPGVGGMVVVGAMMMIARRRRSRRDADAVG